MNWKRTGEVLGLWAALLAVQARILTHVTGQDPFTYVRCARTLLDGRFGLAAWKEVSHFIAPGYPAILAVVLRLAGPFAVAWVNVALLAAVFLLLVRLLRRWGLDDDWAPLTAGLALLWLVVRGYGLNAHFLLYAFRGAPQLLFVMAAFCAVVGAHPGSRWGGPRLALATAILMLGVAVRETTILALPGPIGWVCMNGAWRGRRIRGMSWLLAPVLPVMAAAGLAAAAGWAPMGHYQAQLWVTRFFSDDTRVVLSRATRYLHMLRAEAGWVGAGLFALGVWRLRRRPDVLSLLIAPAVCWIGFYAVYRIHARFFLDGFFLFCVVCGVGAASVVELFHRRLGPAWRHVAAAAVTGALACLLLAETQQLQMWGPRIGRTRIRRLCVDVARHVQPPGRLMVDPGSIYLIETLTVFAEQAPLYAIHEAPEHLARQPLVYARPQSGAYRRQHGLDATEWIRHYADTVSIAEQDGQPSRLKLADEEFSLWRIVPWSAQRTEESLDASHVAGGVFWLDFRSSDPRAARRVCLVTAEGAIEREWALESGSGLMPFHLGSAPENGARLVVESTAALPAALLAHPTHSVVDMGWFTAAAGRRPSLMEWIVPPTRISHPRHKWGAVFETDAAFAAPLPVGQTHGEAVVSVVIEPRFKQDVSAVFRYEAGESLLGLLTNRLDTAATIRHDIRVPMPHPHMVLPLQLHVRTDQPLDNHFRVVAIGVGAAVW